ncbi:hypothetical protein [Halorubrum kocurii]|uniref:Ferrichrome-binding protein n=1 Tax=Halorubrum kocurii JCM 14978 TaxID=1230456 RepID=M0PJ49_9EURY|nr:hypothetical protein [Halorubrum kocurii]EMA70047.1 ferrichrome-binding protein [Halorubrum kocurii JCM 14978]
MTASLNFSLNNSFFGLDDSNVEELTENVAPFIGNTTFRRTDGWHTYRHYTMYEAFEKVSAVFQHRGAVRPLRRRPWSTAAWPVSQPRCSLPFGLDTLVVNAGGSILRRHCVQRYGYSRGRPACGAGRTSILAEF